ncbi:HAD hydrolase-like protein [Acuticoccus sp. MNP-M23]|uniref:HAD-IIA family hydrolase n=1 Tax=Acuticoccus sp. MNP-M23 TaxID=3072793 RepID=UPI002815F189|nr:HAD hydrolase-like protein [Acuticoccus sp. MNP-M23]WMS43041.1 HAD hydrolase-like protein [Acuticoccus sp. MNP-M23]
MTRTTPPPRNIDAEWITDRYEAVRPRLPAADFAGIVPQAVADLSAVADRYDVFVLDGFGVLNVGASAIPGAAARMAELRNAGKRLIVLTNSASYPAAASVTKYDGLGFDFTAAEIISSRDIALEAMADFPADTMWGVTSAGEGSMAKLPGRAVALGDDDTAYRDADAILLLSGDQWSTARQMRLAEALARKPRPVVVANPDLVAPRETGPSIEPGFWAHDLADQRDLPMNFCGKPFGRAFDAVVERVAGNVPRDRFAMVGDTLHTDILGGRAAGFGTVLITAHGVYAGRDAAPFIAATGIVPDHVAVTT